ncbi:MAG: hypothetical protein K2H61_01795, partial [Muribaculaceae bacterium]|nr:hypothetical protein [Muribaculaceae bacterium]
SKGVILPEIACFDSRSLKLLPRLFGQMLSAPCRELAVDKEAGIWGGDMINLFLAKVLVKTQKCVNFATL